MTTEFVILLEFVFVWMDLTQISTAVHVCQIIIHIHHAMVYILNFFSLSILRFQLISEEVDECALNTDNCTQNATCKNIIGGFICTCDAGFSGNGYIQCYGGWFSFNKSTKKKFLLLYNNFFRH